jgi:hypothetical protein
MQTKLFSGLAILAFFQTASAQAQELRELMKKQGYSRICLTRSVGHSEFFIKAKIDGHECNLLVDTGASGTIFIKRPIAEKLGIKLDQHLPNFDKVGSGIRNDIVGYGSASKLEIGNGEYTIHEKFRVTGSDGFEYPATVYDENQKRKTIELDGLIGQQILIEHQFVLDGKNADLFLKSYVEEKINEMTGMWESERVEQDELKSTHAAKLSIDKNHNVEFTYRDTFCKGDLSLVKYDDCDLFYVSKAKEKAIREYVLKGIVRQKVNALELCLIDEESFIAQDDLWQNVKIFPSEFKSKKKMPIIYYKFKRVESPKIVETKK